MAVRWRADRLKPRIAAWALTAGAIALIAAPDRVLAWSPPCLWHSLGIAHCWGCGMTRAFIAVLHGDLLTAIRLNPGIGAVAPLLLWVYVTSLYEALRASYWTEPSASVGSCATRTRSAHRFRVVAQRN